MPTTFSSLPLEIRLQIWAFCVPSPRILTFKLDYSHKPDLYSQNPQPVLLSINHESRAFLLDPFGGGYVLVRVTDTHVAFHSSKDSIYFNEVGLLRRQVLDLTTHDGEIVQIRKLVVGAHMLTHWLEDSELGDRLREWLVHRIELLEVMPKSREDVVDHRPGPGHGYGLYCSRVRARIGVLRRRLKGGEELPRMVLASKVLDTDAFCRELVKKGKQ